MKHHQRLLLGLLAGSVLSPAVVQAQTAPAPSAVPSTGAEPVALDEILVTATRRTQNLQNVPISISALGSEALEKANVSNMADIQGVVPGLQINRNNAVLTLTLRGVGSNFRVQGVDPTVAMHTDGVYISNGLSAQAAFFDVDRIEVVRGPQGVLYGRNASGGAINVISNRPTEELSGYASGSYGAYDFREGELVVSGPIVKDKVLFRVGGYARARNGFGTNLTTGQDNDDLNESGLKAALQFKFSERLGVILRADYYSADDNSLGTEAIPGSAPGRPRRCLPTPAACAPGKTRAETLGGVISGTPHDVYGNVQSQRDQTVWGGSAEVNFELTDRVSLKSLTGYRALDFAQQTDQDATALSVNDPLRLTTRGWQASQELQASYRGEGVFGILGAYYFKERRSGMTFLGFPALDFLPPPNVGDVFQDGDNRTKAWAIFGNADFNLTSKLTLGLGARYSHETKSTQGYNVTIFGPPRYSAAEKTWTAFTPRATLGYEVTPDVTVYGSVSRGFKSGQFGLATPVPADAEFVWAYEAGAKGRFLDGRARATFAAFYYDFKDLQLQVFQGPVNLITNSPKASAYGLEAALELALPADFRFHADATLMHSQQKGLITDDPNTGQANVDLSGNRFPYTPEFSYSASLEKTISWASAGEGVLRVEDQYNSDTYLDIYQNRTNGFRKAYHIFNASYRHTLADGWSITAWGKNLADNNVIMASNFGVGLIGDTRLVNYNPPRTYGLTVKREF